LSKGFFFDTVKRKFAEKPSAISFPRFAILPSFERVSIRVREFEKALSVLIRGVTLQKKLFVGGLPYSTQEDEIRDLFAQAGEVVSANIIRDRFTNQSRGFGFVEMATEDQAADAIKKFNGAQFGGRSIVVNESRPQERKSTGGGGFRGGKRDRY
jgi:RNA recognition motif-containing protein